MGCCESTFDEDDQERQPLAPSIVASSIQADGRPVPVLAALSTQQREAEEAIRKEREAEVEAMRMASDARSLVSRLEGELSRRTERCRQLADDLARREAEALRVVDEKKLCAREDAVAEREKQLTEAEAAAAAKLSAIAVLIDEIGKSLPDAGAGRMAVLRRKIEEISEMGSGAKGEKQTQTTPNKKATLFPALSPSKVSPASPSTFLPPEWKGLLDKAGIEYTAVQDLDTASFIVRFVRKRLQRTGSSAQSVVTDDESSVSSTPIRRVPPPTPLHPKLNLAPPATPAPPPPLPPRTPAPTHPAMPPWKKHSAKKEASPARRKRQGMHPPAPISTQQPAQQATPAKPSGLRLQELQDEHNQIQVVTPTRARSMSCGQDELLSAIRVAGGMKSLRKAAPPMPDLHRLSERQSDSLAYALSKAMHNRRSSIICDAETKTEEEQRPGTDADWSE